MLTPQVTGFGETVLDLMINGQNLQKAMVGGSVLNTMVSLARAGFNCRFISEIGKDAAGELIQQFLLKEKVNSAFVFQLPETQTSLALAVLNPSGDASYSFYRSDFGERFKGLNIHFQPFDIFIFGSSLALEAAVRPTLEMLLAAVKRVQGLVFYDPNIRKHFGENDAAKAYLRYNFAEADVIRGSHEDFTAIFDSQDIEKIFQLIQPSNCKLLIMTAAEGQIHLFTAQQHVTLEVPKVKIISTIGAGDAFNAGVLAFLLSNKIGVDEIESLSQKQLKHLGEMGRSFSALVCASDENYIPENSKTDCL